MVSTTQGPPEHPRGSRGPGAARNLSLHTKLARGPQFSSCLDQRVTRSAREPAWSTGGRKPRLEKVNAGGDGTQRSPVFKHQLHAPWGGGGSLIAFHSVLITSVPFRHSQDWKTPQWGSLFNSAQSCGSTALRWVHLLGPGSTPTPPHMASTCLPHTRLPHITSTHAARGTRTHTAFLGGPGSGRPGGSPRRRGSPLGRRAHSTQLCAEG